jgi:Ala-tRNA(Pro) deacylase
VQWAQFRCVRREHLARRRPSFVEGNDESAFDAGRLDRSIVTNAAYYVRVADPLLADISQPFAS